MIRRKPFSIKISWLSSLHRRIALLLIIQVMIWCVTGFYFSWQGREGLTTQEYWHQLPAQPLVTKQHYETPDLQLQNLGDVRSVQVRIVDNIAQFAATYVPNNTHGHQQAPNRSRASPYAVAWFDGETGHRWQTSAIMAQRLAVDSYLGSGMFNGIRDVHRSNELPHWLGPGFRVDFADDLNTRVYIDQASGEVLGHRNDRWTLIDWMYRLHFMDYSGKRDFNNLFIIFAGLLSVWLSITGILMIVRVWKQGGFVAKR